MDLNEKAQWHKDFNGGMVPVLETPAGDLIKESGIVAQFAIEQGGDDGVSLIPKDPIQAAKMRVEMDRCQQLLQPFFGIYMSRGEDPEKNKALIPTVQAYNDLVKNGTYMFGTEEPTLLDVHFMPFIETLVDFETSVMSNVLADIEFEKNGPHLKAYVAKFRAHPLMQPWYMNTHAAEKHWARTRGWEKGVKCQLTVDYLEECFAKTYGK